MPEIEAGDIVYRLNGSPPMKVLNVDQGVATVSFARPDGQQKRMVYAVCILTRHKRLNGWPMFVVARPRKPA